MIRIKIRIRNRICVLGLILLATLTRGGIPLKAESDLSGQDLAQRIRSAEPEENSEIRGTLIIRRDKTVTQVPVVCRVVLKGATWETEYETSATATAGAEHLVVIHGTNGPNQYLYARAIQPGTPPGKPEPVPPAEAGIPLAGSDFSLADLGLEFLHWPQQQRLPSETRLGQACYVLDSGNPQGREFVRVKSDIDQNSGGLLVATAYDASGKVVKEFSLHGSSFKKVHGHWQLEKMEIRNRKLNSRTELKFDN
jgi:hypothetical protein